MLISPNQQIAQMSLGGSALLDQRVPAAARATRASSGSIMGIIHTQRQNRHAQCGSCAMRRQLVPERFVLWCYLTQYSCILIKRRLWKRQSPLQMQYGWKGWSFSVLEARSQLLRWNEASTWRFSSVLDLSEVKRWPFLWNDLTRQCQGWWEQPFSLHPGRE